jgi:hypothetical protein
VVPGVASGVVSCDLLARERVGVNANKITAESSRNDFNITVLLKKDVGYWHLLEMIDFWHEL